MQMYDTEHCSASGVLNAMTLVVFGTVLVIHITQNEVKVDDLVFPLPLNFTPKKYTKTPEYHGV